MRLLLTPTFIHAVGTYDPPPHRRVTDRAETRAPRRGLATALRGLLLRRVPAHPPVDEPAAAARRT